MTTNKDTGTKSATEAFGEMLKKFSATVGEIFDDPDVKKTAKQFAASVVDAAAKAAQDKVKKEETRTKIRNVGKAAQSLGKSIESHFN